ncbi:MAG: hypothetical protein KGL91_09380 [Xanthomonadaceae bacterium]|nr:hypothetical protein [Xanthomonadaceae bacterium]
MSTLPERSLRFMNAGEQRAAASRHWHARSPAERLQAALALHREGNALFKGGNPAFIFQWELHHVRAR